MTVALVVLVLAAGAWLMWPPARGRFRGVAMKPLPAPTGTTSAVEQGREIFRYETYGDEYFFTDDLKLPFWLLVRIPAPIREKTLGVMTDREGKIVGLEPKVGKDGKTRFGVTCALCHSVVNEKGERLDGVPNHRLKLGTILALSPTISRAQRSVFLSWGPGRLDITSANEAEDNINNPAKMEAAFGTKGIKWFNFNGTFDSAAERSHFTMDIVAHGNGEFVPPAKWGIVNKDLGDGIDFIGPKMPALVTYLETLEPPFPKPGSYDPAMAARGKVLFMGKARCARCHTPPLYTNNQKVKPTEVGTDPAHADSPVFKDGTYKVPQLRGVWITAPYFHDGSAKTLKDVVNHYDKHFGLNLTEAEKNDLVEFLKSLPERSQ
ncbi:MAG TPA: hypothetical protein VGL40_11060 [Bacillota bacterium]